MMNINDYAQDFTLLDKDNVSHSLSSFKGKKVVLYFYPKDSTSGCTCQALGFKDLNEEFSKLNTIIIGISKDSPKSHAKFIEKNSLPFLLLSDESTNVLLDYGVYKEKSMYGKKFMGVVRTTYIIDEEGKILSIAEKVNSSTNPIDTLNYIKSLNK